MKRKLWQTIGCYLSSIKHRSIVDLAFSLLSGKAIAITPRNQHIMTYIHIHICKLTTYSTLACVYRAITCASLRGSQ